MSRNLANCSEPCCVMRVLFTLNIHVTVYMSLCNNDIHEIFNDIHHNISISCFTQLVN